MAAAPQGEQSFLVGRRRVAVNTMKDNKAKENKATDKYGVVAEYQKALKVDGRKC